MKAKEILKNVCVYLGKEELLESGIFESDDVVLDSSQQKEIDKMLASLNLITSEIASDYLPIEKQKEITLTEGQINVFDIDQSIQEIIAVKRKNGTNVKFKHTCDKLICLATNVVVTYKVHPNEITLNSNAESFGGRLSARVLAYGVASEYSYLENLYDDAAIWENRFKNAMLVSSRKKHEVKLKKRGWF